MVPSSIQKGSNHVDGELDAGKNLHGVHVICNKSQEMYTSLPELGAEGEGLGGAEGSSKRGKDSRKCLL